jgi:HSP20 family protein
VWEDESAFHVEAELPGLTREQFQVTVAHRNEVTIQGERAEDESLKGTWQRRERGFGRFQRVLTLSAPVEADKVEARLEYGVLRLTLPKAEEARPRRIAVKTE